MIEIADMSTSVEREPRHAEERDVRGASEGAANEAYATLLLLPLRPPLLDEAVVAALPPIREYNMNERKAIMKSGDNQTM